MTDDQQWQAPGSPSTPPTPGGDGPRAPIPPHPFAPAATSEGTTAPSAPPVPGLPSPAAPGSAAPGWTPPPKPGLVPLRPMTLGTILGASFMVLRRNPKPTLGPALAISLVTFLLVMLLSGGITAWALLRIDSATTSDDADAILAGSIAIGIIGVALTSLLSVVGTALLQGIIVAEVARGTVGEKLRLRGLWARLRGRAWALIGWAVLLSAVLGVAFLTVVTLLVLLGMAGGLGIALAVLFGIGALLGGIALVIWLSTKLIAVPAAIVLERRSIRAAIARSWSLTTGYFWRTFGIAALVGVMLSIAAQVVLTPVTLVAQFGVVLLAPTGVDEVGVLVFAIVSFLVTMIVSAAVSAIVLVVQTATSSLLYLDLRFRKEGLDLELARFAEARQTGTTLPDPYRAETPGAPAASVPTAPAAASPWA